MWKHVLFHSVCAESGRGLDLPAEVFLCLPQLTANALTQETMERIPEIFNSEAPTLTPYLTSGSRSTDELMSKIGKNEEMLL